MHICRKEKRPAKIMALLIVTFLLGSMLTGCTNDVADSGKDSAKQIAVPKDKTLEKEITPVQYYFLNGSLLGSYDRAGWHSLCAVDTNDRVFGDGEDFWANDLLAQDAYYVYDYKNKKMLSVAKQFIWTTGSGGLGSFEDDQAGEKLAAYGELYEPVEGDISLPRIFSLPVKAGQDLAGLKIPDYSFFTQFVIDSETRNEYELVTNRISELFPREIIGGLEATDEGVQALADLLKQEKIENTASNFSDCVKSDFDQDGKIEYLMFANNSRSENGYPLLVSSGGTDRLGVYSAMLYQDNDGSVQTIYSDLRPYQGEYKPDQNNYMELTHPDHCISIDLMTIADLNNDGKVEILARKSGWEYGYFLAYALNAQGQYEPVMRSNYGM
jgi:hypothetical protein